MKINSWFVAITAVVLVALLGGLAALPQQNPTPPPQKETLTTRIGGVYLVADTAGRSAINVLVEVPTTGQFALFVAGYAYLPTGEQVRDYLLNKILGRVPMFSPTASDGYSCLLSIGTDNVVTIVIPKSGFADCKIPLVRQHGTV